jgi:uncharacterized protein
MTSDEIPVETTERKAALIPASIQFHKKGKNNQLLVAAIEPSKDFPIGIAVNTIHEWIQDQGCGAWFQDEEVIAQFAREARKLEWSTEYVLAERKDVQIEIQVSADRLKAWIHISPAFGGNRLAESDLRQALENNHICYGINEERLQEILRQGQCEREAIAEGSPPVQGNKARFDELITESEHKGTPQERNDGSVNYKDLGLFLSVIKGTPLMRRIPPTEGAPGIGVDGNPIPAPMGADRALIPDIGTAISQDDPNVLIATRVGTPSFVENSARVDSMLELEGVNQFTGNVLFDGNVVVRGPVESGFTVKAGLNLTILDTVESANLVAGGNLVLLTGVYGRSKAKISVGGNLEARFLSDCTVHCGGNIEVSDLISHSIVECEGTVRLGKLGGKGQFYGGSLLALKEIRAQILGSVSESTTLVELGVPRALTIRQEKIDGDILKTNRELELVEKEIQLIAPSSGNQETPKAINLKKKATTLAEKLDELRKAQATIAEKLSVARKGTIRASEVHRGVILRIGSNKQIISELATDVFFHNTVETKPSK